MARTEVYRVSVLAIYVVMKHSTIFTRIGDVDTRSFHRHGRDTNFSCLLGYSMQERPPVVDLIFISALHIALNRPLISKQAVYKKFYKLL